MEMLSALFSFKYSQINTIEPGQRKTLLIIVFNLAVASDLIPKELFDFEN